MSAGCTTPTCKWTFRIWRSGAAFSRKAGGREHGLPRKFFVDPDAKLRLRKLDPGYKGDHESEETAKQETEDYRVKLAHQQALLCAQRKHSVLVVLQALDAGGKDVL